MDRREREIVDALRAALSPLGILARNDPKVREREGLARETRLLWGDVPRSIPMREGPVELSVDPWSGQKTGSFLDQRANHIAFGPLARGRTLDAFCHDGGFGLQAAARGLEVVAVDLSADACMRTLANARANGVSERVAVVEANVFDYLTEIAETGPAFDTIVLDPPAFAKNRAARESAARGYREINRRAFGLLRSRGLLVTASCSHHLSAEDFRLVVEAAAADAGRPVQLVQEWSQPPDHPVLLGMPESRYLKVLFCELLE
jgi:23S rRNA (cytosine1962-C5)-methyltransferase